MHPPHDAKVLPTCVDRASGGTELVAIGTGTPMWKPGTMHLCDGRKSFVMPKRWIVERPIDRTSRDLRLARCFGRHCRLTRLHSPGHDPHHAVASCIEGTGMDHNVPCGFLADGVAS